MAQPGYLDRNLTWTRRNAIITLIGISNYLWLNRHLSQNQIHRNRFICSNPLIRWKERKNGWNWIRVSRNFINLIPWKIRGMIDEKSWIDVKLIFEYISSFYFEKEEKGWFERAHPRIKLHVSGVESEERVDKTMHPCFATAWRERGTSANPSFASVYGALSISPNWYLVVAMNWNYFNRESSTSSLVTKFLWRTVAARWKRKRAYLVRFMS